MSFGTTSTVTGADSSRGRVASPAKTARTWPLPGSVTLGAQRAVGAAGGRAATCVQAAPAAMYSTPSVAPGGRGAVGEAQLAGERRPGVGARWRAALCSVTRETGVA